MILFSRRGIVNRKNAVRPLEAVDAPKEPPDDRKAPNPDPKPWDFEVLGVGGGRAGLAAASFCGRKLLRTAVFEGDTWGGILTRWCPDKRIDNYPGVTRGSLAPELACHMIDDARRADVDLLEGRGEETTPGREGVSGA